MYVECLASLKEHGCHPIRFNTASSVIFDHGKTGLCSVANWHSYSVHTFIQKQILNIIFSNMENNVIECLNKHLCYLSLFTEVANLSDVLLK